MTQSSRPVTSESASVQQEVSRLASRPEVRAALDWLRAHEAQLVRWQLELAAIPAPPFGEIERSRWIESRFHELGLQDVSTDQVGNVFGRLGNLPSAATQYTSLSAHLDTVFPAGTPLNVHQNGSRLYGPGVSDNAAGVTGLLGTAAALLACKVQPFSPILFVGNVGEEGEGDLRGMRHIFSDSRWRDSIACSVIIDGAGVDTIVAEALGSFRFEVIVRGPGGHSWSDFGAPNPIFALAKAIKLFTQTPVPASPKTTFNVGVIRGGTSVNSIPESASMRVDLRSTSMLEMERLEAILRRSIAAAVDEENQDAAKPGNPQTHSSGLTAEIISIGNRPAGELASDSRTLQIIRAVDSHLGNTAQIQRASTDANIPLSMGREAIAIGAGGTGGGAHTLQEWFDCNDRELGLRRILLTVLALTER